MAAAMFWPHQTLATALANAARERPAQEALVIFAISTAPII